MNLDNFQDSPLEIQASQYYYHRSYVNTYYAVYRFLEDWIAKNIFRNDKSRVFLSSDQFAYRRRFELTDTSKDFNTLDFSSLRLPFANYWPQNTGWVPDERVAAKQAALSYLGIYEGNTKIRASASIINIPVTFYFDREDDARLAYDILYFKSFNEHYYQTNVEYGIDDTSSDLSIGSVSNILQIPVNITIKSNQFNPQYTENDWLRKQRVYIIKASFDVRTFAILPPKQPDYHTYIEPTGKLSDGSSYEDGISYYYIVDDVILNFGHRLNTFKTYDAGFDITTNEYKGSIPFPEIGEKNVIYVDSYVNESDKGKGQQPTLKLYVWDYVNEKYIEPETELDSKSIRYNGSYDEHFIDISKFDCITNVTTTSNLIEWDYGSDEIIDSLDRIEIHMTNETDIITLTPDKKSYLLEDLSPHSQYYGYVEFFSKNGNSKKFVVNFVTKSEKVETYPPSSSLIGITW